MKKLTTLLTFTGLAILVLSCENKSEKHTDHYQDTVQTVSKKTEQPDNKGTLDMNSIPISDEELGAFPFFSLPEGVQEQNKAIKRSFDMLFFPINGVMTPMEGKVWKSYIVKNQDSEESWSAPYFLKSYDDAIISAGGVKIFDGKVASAEMNRIKDQATYFGEEGSIDYWNNPVRTYLIRRAGGDDIYLQISANSASGAIQILQKGPLKQTIKLLKADQIQNDLNNKGKAVLYINFDTNKATLKADGKKAVDEIYQVLSNDKALKIDINGYTDNVGEQNLNLQLSKQRAETVKTELVKNGIAENRLTSAGFGQNNPIGDNNSEEGKAKNRRVELVKK